MTQNANKSKMATVYGRHVAIFDHVKQKNDYKAMLNPLKLPKPKVKAIGQTLKKPFAQMAFSRWPPAAILDQIIPKTDRLLSPELSMNHVKFQESRSIIV